jgi:hypothetical protein
MFFVIGYNSVFLINISYIYRFFEPFLYPLKQSITEPEWYEPLGIQGKEGTMMPLGIYDKGRRDPNPPQRSWKDSSFFNEVKAAEKRRRAHIWR